MKDMLQTLMHDAARLAQEGRLQEAIETMQRAIGEGAATAGDAAGEAMQRLFGGSTPALADVPAPPTSSVPTGALVDDEFTCDGQSRRYLLYLPTGPAGQSRPLVVMLHGCTQSPEDFAAGTGMNQLADELGFIVLYPVQSAEANPNGCWNWFEPVHQARDTGEPALLAALTRAVIAAHPVDARRVYVAGMSAGGAMADILGQAYPDIFAAVGVHSGLPCGAAGNMSDAFAVMGNGQPDIHASSPTGGQAAAQVPIIVFHGDRDRVVHPGNGDQVVAAALRRASIRVREGAPGSPARIRVEQGVTPLGRAYTRTVHDDHAGAAVAEHWLVHGAGHTWSGGREGGSYTDLNGPDAAREMLRFFLARAREDD